MSGRVLVTGATGFVGSHLARHLAASGTSLTLAVRSALPHPPPGDVRTAPIGDIGPDTDWSAALDGVEAVIHTAAHVHVAPERASREAALFETVNVDGTAALFDAAARHDVRLFVFLSSVTVLGDARPAGRPLDDRSPPDPLTPYARSKHRAEQRLADAASQHPGTRLVVLRPPLICGPGVRGNLGALLRLAATPLPLPLGHLRNRRTLLSLGTLAGAIDAVLASREGALREGASQSGAGTFLIGDREPVSTSDIVTALRAGLGRSPGLLPAPTTLMTAAARLAGRPGMAARLLNDMELDSRRFRQVFGPIAEEDTRASLHETARAFAAGR